MLDCHHGHNNVSLYKVFPTITLPCHQFAFHLTNHLLLNFFYLIMQNLAWDNTLILQSNVQDLFSHKWFHLWITQSIPRDATQCKKFAYIIRECPFTLSHRDKSDSWVCMSCFELFQGMSLTITRASLIQSAWWGILSVLICWWLGPLPVSWMKPVDIFISNCLSHIGLIACDAAGLSVTTFGLKIFHH